MKQTLDARNLLCPMPVIRVQQTIKNLQSGDLLEVVCTDPGTLQDIPTWCRMYEHEIIETQKSDHEFIFVIKVKKP